jgi:transposase
MSRRKFTPKFKTRVVLEAIKEHQSLTELAEKYELHVAQISKWKRDFLSEAEGVFEKKDKEWNAEKLLRYQGFALEQRTKQSQQWIADTLTPSSLQNVCMIPALGEALAIPGEAPKFFNGEAWSLTKTFSAVESKIVKLRGKSNSPHYQKGLGHFMRSQVAHDTGDIHGVYHNIQLAIDYFDGDAYQVVARFYFLVFQYIHEDHRKTLSSTLNGFKELDGKLPPYLNDHCTLFIARLEKITRGSTTVGIDEIQNLNLQRIFDFEMKMPRLLFHRATRELMAPRLELLDIFYPHVKAG